MRSVPSGLVIGVDSRIGRALAEDLALDGRLAGFTTRREGRPGAVLLDLAAAPATWPRLGKADSAFFCAGVTSAAACREDARATAEVNVKGTVELARRLVEEGAFVVWFSTNMVFDGSLGQRRSGDPTCPTTEYGRQKAAAERELLALGPGLAVLRLTKVVGPGDPLLTSWRHDLAAGRPVNPFMDKVLAPVWLAFVVTAARAIARRGDGGVWQASAQEDVTYAAAAHHLARRLGVSGELVVPLLGAGPETAGEFPRHTTLETSRLDAELDLCPPDVLTTIERGAGC